MFARSFDSISKNVEKSSAYAELTERFGYAKQKNESNENQGNEKNEHSRHDTSNLETAWVMFLS